MGDYEEMINDINNIIQIERKNNKKWFNVKNIYFNDIEKFICDKTLKKVIVLQKKWNKLWIYFMV